MPLLVPPEESSSELYALIQLLDDSDPQVTTAVQHRLIWHGARAVPYLRAAIANSKPKSPLALNAESCIRAIRTNALATLIDRIFDACVADSDIALEESLALLSVFGYPDTEHDALHEQLDRLWLDAERTVRTMTTRTDVNALLALNRAMFDQAQFRGAGNDYHTPQRIYLAPVFKHRCGIPITLSCIYMLVAERMGIELWGIGMPLHFIVYSPALNIFIDPFNGGLFISHDECRRFVEQVGFSFSEEMLSRRSNREIIVRTIRNAVYAHTRNGHQWEAETLEETLGAIERIARQG
jgi:regulator of sirC expression with transglutaminase-like and TPR domain